MAMWEPDSDLLAQLGHFGWGAFITLAFNLFGHIYLGMVIFFACWVLPKEFIFDIKVEGDDAAGGARDAAFYLCGMMVAFGLMLVRKAFN